MNALKNRSSTWIALVLGSPTDDCMGCVKLLAAIAHHWLGDYAEAERFALEASQDLPKGSAGWCTAMGYFATAYGSGRREGAARDHPRSARLALRQSAGVGVVRVDDRGVPARAIARSDGLPRSCAAAPRYGAEARLREGYRGGGAGARVAVGGAVGYRDSSRRCDEAPRERGARYRRVRGRSRHTKRLRPPAGERGQRLHAARRL